jgi:hypothetical protein
MLRRRVHTVTVAAPGVDLVVEGFPRSGNSFAREAILLANPHLSVASHVHRAAHVLHALDLGIPALVLVRDVEDAVSSAMFLRQFNDPDAAMRQYRRFYRDLWRYRHGFVVATFGQVVTDMGTVIARLNTRFAAGLVAFEHTGVTEDAVFSRLDEAASDGTWIDEYAVARPSTARASLARANRDAIREANPALRAACMAETERFMQLAAAPR